jgi:hypothetical protein
MVMVLSLRRPRQQAADQAPIVTATQMGAPHRRQRGRAIGEILERRSTHWKDAGAAFESGDHPMLRRTDVARVLHAVIPLIVTKSTWLVAEEPCSDSVVGFAER